MGKLNYLPDLHKKMIFFIFKCYYNYFFDLGVRLKIIFKIPNVGNWWDVLLPKIYLLNKNKSNLKKIVCITVETSNLVGNQIIHDRWYEPKSILWVFIHPTSHNCIYIFKGWLNHIHESNVK